MRFAIGLAALALLQSGQAFAADPSGLAQTRQELIYGDIGRDFPIWSVREPKDDEIMFGTFILDCGRPGPVTQGYAVRIIDGKVTATPTERFVAVTSGGRTVISFRHAGVDHCLLQAFVPTGWRMKARGPINDVDPRPAR